MTTYAGEAEAVIAAAAEDVFAALVDYEHLAEWQGPVKAATVLTRDAQGRGRDVRYEIDVRLATVRYTLRHGYEEPTRITSEYVEGDFRDCQGEWTFRDRGDGTTEGRFALRIDPGRLIPRPVAKMLNERVMKASVEDVRRHFARS